jgi:hypothetical protein
VIIVASILCSATILYLLHRVWPSSKRRAHNDVVGPSVEVLGTTYAVILAFMLSGVWTNFRSAESNTEREANSLVNLYRITRALPERDCARIQQLVREYASVIVDEEWPAMRRGTISPKSHDIVEQIWKTLAQIQPQTPAQQLSLDHSLAEMSTFTQFRRVRQLQSRSHLPPMLWAVLIVGAIVTVGSACLFGVEDFKIHLIQIFFLAFMVSLVLVAIANIDQPFRGPVHISSDSFRFALDTFSSDGR